MKEQSFIKKIFNVLLHILLAISSFIKRLFKKEKKQDVKNNPNIHLNEQNTENTNKLPDSIINGANSTNSSDNQNNNNNNNDVMLNITNRQFNKFKETMVNKSFIFTDEEIDILIDEYLEEKEYKEEKLKIKDLNKDLEEKLKELKEKVKPIIKKDIEKKDITTIEKLKEEIEEVVKEEIKEKPLIPKIKDIPKKEETPTYQEPYFIATPLKRSLQMKQDDKPKSNLANKIMSSHQDNEIKKEINKQPYFMVQNIAKIPQPDFKEEIKNGLLIGGMMASKAVLDITTDEKDEKKEIVDKPIKKDTLTLKADTPPQVKKEKGIVEVELPKLKEIKNDINNKKDYKNVDKPEELIVKNNNKINDEPPVIDEPIKEDIETDKIDLEIALKDEKKQTDLNEHETKIDNEILNLTFSTAMVIQDANKEAEKKEFEDKQYDFYESHIDKMLDNLENTLIKYDGKISDKQKNKIKTEQEKLRQTKDELQKKKENDIFQEEKALSETIKEEELKGLQKELAQLEIENQMEMNEQLLNRMDNLDNLTKKQIANIDKKMLFRRINKVSRLLEISSILSLPFIRNKYFFYFTIGLIVDNHFNFINGFFKRKINKYKPANLEQIKQGEDAVNSALNVTYKNLVELECIEQEALNKYPELINDPQFVNKVTNLKIKLDYNYNKLMKKKQVMEKYHRQTKSQIRVLKKDEIRKAVNK